MNADIPSLMLQLDGILAAGYDAQYVLGGLASHIRDLLVARDSRTTVLLTVPDEIKQRYISQAQSIDYANATDALTLLSSTLAEYRASKNQRLLTEICLMRLASLGLDPSKKKLLTT